MTGIIELSIISTIILIILSQRLDIRVYGKYPVKISIGFTLLALELSLTSKKRKKKKHVPIKKKISRSLFAISLIRELLAHSSVAVRSIGVLPPSKAEDIPKLTLAAIYLPLILTYIRASAKSYERIKTDEGGMWDVLFSFSLPRVFISLIKVSYYKIKSKLEKRKHNAREQNQ